MKPQINKKQYLPIIVLLRGLAAVAVCMYHFTRDYLSTNNVLWDIFKNGWMGVEVFFVISGFVIPYSLLGTSFGFQHYFKFLKKRLLRIQSAYLASILLVIVIGIAASKTRGFEGNEFEVSSSLIAQHIFYIVEFFQGSWLNPVYWSLEVEFHYYLLIGLLIPLWNLKKPWLIFSTVIGLLVLSLINQNFILFFKYIDIFVLGVITAFYKKEQLSLIPYVISIFIIGFIVYDSHGLLISIITILTTLLIAFKSFFGNVKALKFLGNISYSLYLIHVPIGLKIINLSKRLQLNEISKTGVVFVALGFSIFAAWLLYKYIEKPSHDWARKVTFN
nr:acyltransferase [uncultured Psychroserpens sp.]